MRFWLAGLLFIGSVAMADLKSPNISANTLFLYRQSNFSREDLATTRNGLDLQEAELAFFADVDPYSRLSVLLSVHPEYDNSTGAVEQSWVIEPEELFAESDVLPGTTLRVGKFKAAMGKHNLLHTHAFPLIEAPLVNSQLLGDEGLNDVGLSAAILLPTNWFSELTLQYLRGEGENSEFQSPSPNDGIGLAHWKGLWDLNEGMTLEVGGSYAAGKNSFGKTTTLSGADVTVKWRPTSGGKYHSWMVGAEYLNRALGQTTSTEDGNGWNLFGQYQFAERWSAIARYDYVHLDTPLTGQGYAGALTFNATEFSSYRLEYAYIEGIEGPFGGAIERRVLIQGNFTIGAHPAHSY